MACFSGKTPRPPARDIDHRVSSGLKNRKAKSMRSKLLAVATLLASATLVSSACAAPTSGVKWVNPAVKDYGRVHPVPDARLMPDKHHTYKVVFDVKSDKQTDGVNASLWHVARAVNVFALAGVDRHHRKFAVVIHGAATPLIMKADAYRTKTGKVNPDLKLISELKKAGVTLYICGQAAADNGIAAKDINPEITMTLSALADLPVLQSRGYTLFPM